MSAPNYNSLNFLGGRWFQREGVSHNLILETNVFSYFRNVRKSNLTQGPIRARVSDV